MNERDILAGLKDVPWPDLECAGSPAEIPGLLRTLASGADEADEALTELACSLCHQGSVYPASEHAAPFLARIAAAGLHPELVLEVLGSIAECRDERGLSAPGAVRAAVAAQSGLLAPLLADPHPEVRAAAAWALTQAQAPALVPLLGERWNTEAHPLVRATILKALSVLAPDLAARLASGVLADSVLADGGLLLIAAAACLAAGQPWTDRLHAAATAWMADGEVLPKFWGGDHDPFEDLALALAARGEPAAAVRLIAAGLTYSTPGPSAPPARPGPRPAFRASPGPGRVRQRSAWSALELARAYRSPAEALVLPLSVAAADEDAGFSAISLLRELRGAAVAVAPPAADLPVVDQPAVTGRLAALADVPGEDRRADEALACLIELADPRAARLLARDLRHRPHALNAAANAARSQLPSSPFPPLTLSSPALPCDAALLDAVRGYLRAPELRARRVRVNVPGDLLTLVHSWGPDAAPAIPELLGLRAVPPLNVAITLTAVDPAHPDLLPRLRQIVATGRSYERTSAASRLRDLTGEDGPLLAVLEDGLRQQGYELRSTAEDIAKLGPRGRA
ncbi:MAG TPA: HEAT repeat domain-containing protein [Streptosporangiaceae bacterium]|nr:HEAT repeat domain-containing protein [Streptosporangiaceae bacterium]